MALLVPDHVIASAVDRFVLDPDGDHGFLHWNRVASYGLLLQKLTPGADMHVIAHFAVLHDMCRVLENQDPCHGQRAATALDLIDLGHLSLGQQLTLKRAIHDHSGGQTTLDPTMGCCWDADRLDLMRLGIDPLPELMSTDPAKTLCRDLR
jgi:uncharacterized protein